MICINLGVPHGWSVMATVLQSGAISGNAPIPGRHFGSAGTDCWQTDLAILHNGARVLLSSCYQEFTRQELETLNINLGEFSTVFCGRGTEESSPEHRMIAPPRFKVGMNAIRNRIDDRNGQIDE